MEIAFFVGRVVVGLYFLQNAYNHIFKGSHMFDYARGKGVPNPRLAIFGSGLLLLVGGLSFLTGYFIFWGTIALLVFMIPVTFVMHRYWLETDPMAKMNDRINFTKNLAIVGFLLMFLSL